MINKVEIRTAKGDLLSLPFEDYSNGYAVLDIDGLGPVKATIVKSSFAQMNGTQYHSSSLEDRNITLKLGLYPNWGSSDVEDLRNALYNYLLPMSLISLKFYNDKGLIVDIIGRVESLEPEIFSNEPIMNASIICFDPDFLEPDLVVLVGSTVADTTEAVVPYVGTIETGFTLALNINRTLTEFTIYNRPPDGSLRKLDFAAPLSAGDTLTISTITGAKGATLLRSGTSSSLLYGVSPQSNWISLQKGDNNFRVYATGAAIPYTLTYTTRHGGL